MPGSGKRLSAAEELKTKLAERERQRGVARQGIEQASQKLEHEQGAEAANITQESRLDAVIGDSHVLTEEQEMAMEKVQGAQTGQVKSIARQEEVIAEKLRLLKHLEELSRPVRGRRPRVEMASAEAEPAEREGGPRAGAAAPAGQYAVRVVPPPKAPEAQSGVYFAPADRRAVVEVEQPKPTPLIRLTRVQPAERDLAAQSVAEQRAPPPGPVVSCTGPLGPRAQAAGGRRSRVGAAFL